MRIEYAAPGETPLPHRGDIIVTQDPRSLVCRAIRLAQAVRFRGGDAVYAGWNHVACVVGDAGELIEAKGRARVHRAHVTDYAPRWYAIGHVHATPEDAAEMVAFAESCLGESYGYLTIVSLLAWVLTGGRLTVTLDGTEVCSTLAARFLERAGAIFPRGPESMMPADIARKYAIPVPG